VIRASWFQENVAAVVPAAFGKRKPLAENDGHLKDNRMLDPKFLAVLALAAGAASSAAEPTELATFAAISRPRPSIEVRYGPAQAQSVDVFLPGGSGPYSVAILVHGGCWSVNTAGREQFRHLGAELTRGGVAVWSIGYRRANEPGGGYPGTYQDVGAAIDRLRAEASRYNFNLSRTVLVGHSAGGHLALWAAARRQLPATSPLKVSEPVPSRVISLAGIGDVKSFAPFVPVICGPGIVERLKAAPSPGSSDAYADISPASLPAPDAQIVVVSGVLDRLVPPYVAHDYVRAMRAKGSHRSSYSTFRRLAISTWSRQEPMPGTR
jgi:acetyl esterase/lipase